MRRRFRSLDLNDISIGNRNLHNLPHATGKPRRVKHALKQKTPQGKKNYSNLFFVVQFSPKKYKLWRRRTVLEFGQLWPHNCCNRLFIYLPGLTLPSTLLIVNSDLLMTSFFAKSCKQRLKFSVLRSFADLVWILLHKSKNRVKDLEQTGDRSNISLSDQRGSDGDAASQSWRTGTPKQRKHRQRRLRHKIQATSRAASQRWSTHWRCSIGGRGRVCLCVGVHVHTSHWCNIQQLTDEAASECRRVAVCLRRGSGAKQQLIL